MEVTLTSTEKVVTLINGEAEIPARLWEGVTSTGIPVHVYITRIAVAEGRSPEDYREFERQLLECRKPSADVAAITPRLIL